MSCGEIRLLGPMYKEFVPIRAATPINSLLTLSIKNEVGFGFESYIYST